MAIAPRRKLAVLASTFSLLTFGLTFSGLNMAVAEPGDNPASPSASDSNKPADSTAAAEKITPIVEIQGTDKASPMVGKTVTTTGIVTAILSGRGGFVMQMKSADVPKDNRASSAIFVKLAQPQVKLGDELLVTGAVQETYKTTFDTNSGKEVLDKNTVMGVTTINVTSPDKILVKGTGKSAEVNIPTLPMAKTPAEKMARELMVFQPAGKYRVTGNDQLVYTGQLSLNDGDKPLLQPTQAGLPGSVEARSQAEYNDQHMLVLDDGNDAHFDVKFPETFKPAPPKELPYMADAAKGPTLGATVSFTKPVIVNHVEGNWVMDPIETQPAKPAAVNFSAVRENAPADVGGNFKLATFNVLNYFTSFGESNKTEKDGKPLCYPEKNLWDKKYDLTGNWDCPNRGAWNEESFKRQQAKIVNAINKLGSDGAQIVGLQEIENATKFGKDYDSALKHLVEELNKADAKQGWVYAPAPKKFPKYGHDDVIRQAFIYKKDAIELVGDSQFLDDPAYQSAADARAPIAQAFKHKATGKVLLVINNHLTYKGGKVVGDDNVNPGRQEGPAYDLGNNNGDRTRQAKALVGFAEKMGKETGAEFTFLVGDFNAYSYETPIQTMVAAGYSDLMNTNEHPSMYSATDWNEYTYSYRSIFGSLDHVMVSKSAMKYMKGFDVWTSNGYEPIAYEYARFMDTGTNYWSGDVFRASDHNASIAGFELPVTKPSQPQPGDSSKVTPVDKGKGTQPESPQTGSNGAGVLLCSLLLLAVGALMVAKTRRI